MAKFKLELVQKVKNKQIEIPFTIFDSTISRKNTDDNFYYLSYFDDQQLFNRASLSYDYSYNEQVSFHTNAQAELTFNMLKYVTIESEFVINPFATVLTTGSIIKLTDQFNVIRYFWVNNISYQITKLNIEYSFTCQDTFSYLYTRKNNGYSITNDSSKANFIGPQTVDEWARKIKNDCGMLYNYVPLQKANKWTATETALWNQPIMFDISNSNAYNALVSLGKQAGLILEVDENNVDHKFWFKPEKNPNFNGLLYSPYNDIKQFDLSQQGENLVTILNVFGQQINDRTISLLDKLPSELITEGFNAPQWLISRYYPGFYNDICGPRSYDLIALEDIQKHKKDYDQAQDEEQAQSVFNDISQRYKIYFDDEHFAESFKDPEDDLSGFLPYILDRTELKDEKYIIKARKNYLESQQQEIWEDLKHKYPAWCANTSFEAAFKNDNDLVFYKYFPLRLGIWNEEIDNTHIIEDHYATIPLINQDTKDFLQVIENIPWLENKIINFEYFYYNHLISKRQHEELWELLTNDLRINNGQFLYYSQLYFNALNHTNNIMVHLDTNVDQYGATYLANIVNKIETTGKDSFEIISLTDANKEDLVHQYDNLLTVSNAQANIMNYSILVNDYGNKYIQAQQRLFKNLYLFRNYVFQNGLTWDVIKEAPNNHLYSTLMTFTGDIWNLTTYWNEAYKASILCDFYIPEQFQFALFDIYGEEDKILNLTRFNEFLPIITKTHQKVERDNTKKHLNIFSKYKYVDNITLENSTKANTFFNTRQKNGQFLYRDNQHIWIGVSGTEIEDDWYDINTTVNRNNLWTWDNLSKKCGWITEEEEGETLPEANKCYSATNGRYPLLLYLLIHKYKADTNNWENEYRLAKKTHDNLWNLIYQMFGDILLEQEFEDSSAIDSVELLHNALVYFKDLSNPEYSYNISIININSLRGYNGDRINISDQIQVNADEFYGEIDDLKNMIRQPLFISDISYNLRSDAEINLTVNTIKYQDQVIDRLVSLIK